MKKILGALFFSLLIGYPLVAQETAKDLFLKAYTQDQSFAQQINHLNYHLSLLSVAAHSSTHSKESFDIAFRNFQNSLSNDSDTGLIIPLILAFSKNWTRTETRHQLLNKIETLRAQIYNALVVTEQNIKSQYLKAMQKALEDKNPYLPAVLFGNAATLFLPFPQAPTTPPATKTSNDWDTLYDVAEFCEFGDDDVTKDPKLACLWYFRANAWMDPKSSAIFLALSMAGSGFCLIESDFKAIYNHLIINRKIPKFTTNPLNVFGTLWAYRLSMFVYPLLLDAMVNHVYPHSSTYSEYITTFCALCFICWFGESVMTYTPHRSENTLKSMTPIILRNQIEHNVSRRDQFRALLIRLDTQLTTQSCKLILKEAEPLRKAHLMNRLDLKAIDLSTRPR